jgi:hypothetical protein
MFDIEKLKLNNFLGCISLRTGAFIIGSFEAVSTVFYLLIYLIAIINVGSKHESLREFRKMLNSYFF